MGLLNPAFSMQCQLKANWCWAAVTAAVKQYSPPLAPERQCEFATAALRGGRNCCAAPDTCDRPFSLRTSLTAEGKLKDFLLGQISFRDIKKQIDVFKQPVCARIGWDTDADGFATIFHFVVIVGYQDPGPTGVPWVSVMDPDVGAPGLAGRRESTVNDMAFEEFRSRYRLFGTWLQTYVVK